MKIELEVNNGEKWLLSFFAVLASVVFILSKYGNIFLSWIEQSFELLG